MINKISRKYKNMSFNINLMYLSKWIHDERVLKNVLSNVSKNIETLSLLIVMVPSARTNKKFLVNVKSKNLKGLKVGTHFHNNCGLALANSLAAYNCGSEIIDTTFTGMGRGAGNAETELF